MGGLTFLPPKKFSLFFFHFSSWHLDSWPDVIWRGKGGRGPLAGNNFKAKKQFHVLSLVRSYYIRPNPRIRSHIHTYIPTHPMAINFLQSGIRQTTSSRRLPSLPAYACLYYFDFGWQTVVTSRNYLVIKKLNEKEERLFEIFICPT